MDQNLSLYKIFNTVARTKNISKAAKELYISQPAISKSISKLEQNMNVTLFTRGSRGVQLTEEGELLFEYTQTAFEALELGEENIRKANRLGIGHIRIGVSSTLCKYVLLPYLKKFVELYPHIKITISCQSTFHTVKLLENNKINIGLIGKPDYIKNLNFHLINTIEDIFVTTESYIEHLKLRETESEFDLFKSANIMLLDEENITRLYIDKYLKMHQLETNHILEVSNMDLLIEFAKIGLGVACVIKDFVKSELESGELIEVPLEAPIDKREIGFAYSKDATLTDSMKKFITFYQGI